MAEEKGVQIIKQCDSIPRFTVESMIAHMERTIRRLWILCILLIVLLVGTNIAWIYYESQFQVVTETTQEVTQDTDNGNNLFVGRDYGKTNR